MIAEEKYPGNLGMMEMFKFYQVATEAQKQQMRKLIYDKKMKEAWDLLKRVTKVDLED